MTIYHANNLQGVKQRMNIIYKEADGDLAHLAGRTIGVVGYGDLGRPMAFNLRDQGLAVVAAGITSDEQNAIQVDGFPLQSVDAIAQSCHLIMMMLPDEIMVQVYMAQVSPYLKRGHTLIFASAYNIAFGFIEAPPFVDVGLVAPRTLGNAPRSRFASDNADFYSFVAVGQDASGHTWQTVLAVALAIGALRTGAMEINIEQEAEISLFIQQAILPALHHVMVTAAHLLMKEGYPPEAILSDLYLSGKFSEYMKQASQTGLLHALTLIPKMGQYSTLSRLSRFSELKLERLMEVTLDEIRNGDFAQEWTQESTDGFPRLNKLMKQENSLDLWELEQQTLDMQEDRDLSDF